MIRPTPCRSAPSSPASRMSQPTERTCRGGGGGQPHPDPPPHPGNAPCARIRFLVYQVPIPEPLRFLEPRENRDAQDATRLEEYGLMHVRLYEDIARHGEIAQILCLSPSKVEGGRYVMDPVADPENSDNPKLGEVCPALQLFAPGASSASMRCRPITRVEEPRFFSRITPFKASKPDQPCALCGAKR